MTTAVEKLTAAIKLLMGEVKTVLEEVKAMADQIASLQKQLEDCQGGAGLDEAIADIESVTKDLHTAVYPPSSATSVGTD